MSISSKKMSSLFHFACATMDCHELPADNDASAKMNLTTLQPSGRRLRLLVAIASFGEKNLKFLKRIVRNYRNMSMDVDVIVFSNTPKDLSDDVKVIVGLPSKNPWSLPFAHKAYFAQNVDRYDLFIYSEDDMEVAEKNIQAFLRVTPELEPEEIAGFLRYEMDESGNRSLPEVHGPFHWKPESLKRRGAFTIAEFTNEHAGFYILTQVQLRQAIASGGFLVDPCEGRYDMLVSAATDAYTRCGFRKVICVSALEDFLIHHLPNRYARQLGLPYKQVQEQLRVLFSIQQGVHPATTLCKAETRFWRLRSSKSYYEEPDEQLLALVPNDAKSVLSVGCGWGRAEQRLIERGATITALPMDSVIGAVAARRGIDMVYGTLEECYRKLKGRRFDCVFISNLLHLLPTPSETLTQLSEFVGCNGTIVIGNPNFTRFSVMVKRMLGVGDYANLGEFTQSGISHYGPSFISAHLRRLGFCIASVRWVDLKSYEVPAAYNYNVFRRLLGRFEARDWIMQARR